eukprot:791012-Ditylum_brightwellii.AAC.1
MKPTSGSVNDLHSIDNPRGADKLVGQMAGDNYKKILDAKYEKAGIEKTVSEQCAHLSKTKQTGLVELLNKFETLLDGTLGTWKGTKYNIELQEGAKPYHKRPYSVPKAYEQSFSLEVDQLEKIRVLCK